MAFKDNQNEQRFERSQYPNADPGDPNAGKRVEDEGEPMPAAIADIWAAAKEKIRELGFDASIEIIPIEEKTTTPTQDFAAAVERYRNPELAAARASIGDMSKMTPMARFKALSNLRWRIK